MKLNYRIVIGGHFIGRRSKRIDAIQTAIELYRKLDQCIIDDIEMYNISERTYRVEYAPVGSGITETVFECEPKHRDTSCLHWFQQVRKDFGGT